MRVTGEYRSVVLPLILAAVVIATASCGMPKRMRSMFGGELSIPVTIVEKANENRPLAVEVIVAYDEKMADELLKMSARKWFEGRDQFLRDHPGTNSLKREWIPGQTVDSLKLSYGLGAKRVVVFADYLVPGEHRAIVDPPQRPVKLVLDKSELKLVELR